MNQKKYIREKETKFIKDKLKENKNLLVVGEKGVGKTTVIEQASKQASKKILSIDLMEIQNTKNLFCHLSFKGKIDLFLEKIWQNILKIIGICISILALIISITIGYGDWTKWFFLLIPLDIFMLILIITRTTKYFLKNKTNKIIHFHELNFINDKNKREELLKIIWKIKNIYENHLLIFETDEKFDQELKYKFNLKEIHLKTINKWFLIEDLFKNFEKKIENEEIKQKLLKRFIDWTHYNQRYINEIMNKLTYRTFKNVIDDFKDMYIFSKQEINLVDFLFLKFLQLKNTKLYYEIMKDEVYDELINNKTSLKKETFMKEIRLLLPQFSRYIEDYTHSSSSSFTSFENTKIYSFFKPVYRLFYFSILNYDFLEMELIEKFQNEPLAFLKTMIESNLNEIESFNFLKNEKIIQFLNFIEKQNSEKILNLFFKNGNFIIINVFLNLKTLIINSRKDPKKFFNLLPLKYKYYFFDVVYKYFSKEELQKIKNSIIPFKIKQMPKNLILFDEQCDGNKIFDWKKYYKNLIKNKNKFAVLLSSQGEKSSFLFKDFVKSDSNNKNFILWNFLSISEKSFVVKCFDECNKKVSKNNRRKIKKTNAKLTKWVELTKEELEKYRNYKK